MIKNISISCNNDIKSNNLKKELIKKLENNKFKIVTNNEDLRIAIGGDGSFLRMIKSTNFNSDIYYIGINTGTLGFAQEVRSDELDDFIEKLSKDEYKTEYVSILELEIETNTKKEKMFALNDVTLRDSELNTTKLNIEVDGHKLEKFVGDGILVSTSFGSTAYNLSFGGSVICNSLHTTQITPIAPLNSKVYRNLLNSIVIPQDSIITVKPEENKDNLIITVDGENKFYDNVKSITMYVKDKRIKMLREQDYNFIDKVNEKFLK